MRNGRIFFHSLSILLALLLVGCEHVAQEAPAYAGINFQTSEKLTPYYPEVADNYLEKAQTQGENELVAHQLQALGRLIQVASYTRAEQLFQEIIQNELSQSQEQQLQLLAARLALKQNHPKKAMRFLGNIQQVDKLGDEKQLHYHHLLAKIYEDLGKHLQSAKQYDYLSTHLSRQDPQQHITFTSLWENLDSIEASKFSKIALHRAISSLQPWIELAAIAKQSTSNATLLEKVARWKENYSKHPANDFVHSLKDPLDYYSPQQIALMIPLSGKLKNAGLAIQDGFMAAHYAENHAGPTIRIYDTGGDESIKHIYRRAISEGADFVVGPLDKTKVLYLHRSTIISKPSLALNYAPERRYFARNMYYFGISPQDEAREVAQKAWRNGYRRAFVIAPKGGWGEGIQTAFAKQWQQLGGQIVETLRYAKKQNLNDEIKKSMHLKMSEEHHATLEDLLGKKVNFIPRRRKDIDMIFLAADPRHARAIRPLLKFYYAGNIPIYATSLIYNGTAQARRDHDLNGIIFCDIL